MSHGVVRGKLALAQLYLDAVLDAVIQDRGSRATARDHVNMAELLFYCLKTNPGATHSINAATGEKFTNGRILKRAVSLARALSATCATETVIIMLQNHEHMSALYYAVLLAGVIPLCIAPGSTENEIHHFISLVLPRIIFCEPDRRIDIISVLQKCDIRSEVMVADKTTLDKFVNGYSDDIDSFQLPKLKKDSSALMLPTSGTTGLPKVAMLNHQGLVIQIPGQWLHHRQFPRPTKLVMLLSTPQWITHTALMTSCPVLQVPILMIPVKITVETILEAVEKYRPSWAILNSGLATQLGHLGTPEQLSSIETLYVVGTFYTPQTVACLKAKLPASASLLNAYGLTEVHGPVAIGRSGIPLNTPGPVSNVFEYRLVNANDEMVSKPYEKGELYLRSKFNLKGYLKNEAAYLEIVTSDGWLKTGDIFYKDEDEQLFFCNRSKLGFKCLYYNVATVVYPEEIERVIDLVPGVQQSIVCNSFSNGSEMGPTAAVVLRPGCDVTKRSIHHAVNSTLMEYQRLRGGIAFVPSLPTNCNGKLDRASCFQLIQELVRKGECL